MVIPEHVADLQIFMINLVVGVHQSERRLMVKVGTLATYLEMRFGEQLHRFTPAAASLLAARKSPLGDLQLACRLQEWQTPQAPSLCRSLGWLRAASE